MAAAESERVPGVMGGGVPALVTLGTGNVYCLWLPVCFQPLTSPFVSHQRGPTLFTQALHTAGGWAMDGDLVSDQAQEVRLVVRRRLHCPRAG